MQLNQWSQWTESISLNPGMWMDHSSSSLSDGLDGGGLCQGMRIRLRVCRELVICQPRRVPLPPSGLLMASAIALWSCWSAIRFAGLPRAGTVQPGYTHLEIGSFLRPETVFPEPWQLAVSFLLYTLQIVSAAHVSLYGKSTKTAGGVCHRGLWVLPTWCLPSYYTTPVMVIDCLQRSSIIEGSTSRRQRSAKGTRRLEG